MSPVAQAIYDRMLELDMSQTELNRRAGLKSNAVKALLNGETKYPRADILSKIAGALGSTSSELLGETPGGESGMRRTVFRVYFECLRLLRDNPADLPPDIEDSELELIARALADDTVKQGLNPDQLQERYNEALADARDIIDLRRTRQG